MAGDRDAKVLYIITTEVCYLHACGSPVGYLFDSGETRANMGEGIHDILCRDGLEFERTLARREEFAYRFVHRDTQPTINGVVTSSVEGEVRRGNPKKIRHHCVS